jgi:ArsR family transcriptional regulator
MRLTDELFDQVAVRFKALAEPARLRILDALRDGERTVGDLGERTGLNQANLSKHLQLLHALGFVARRKDGLFVYYSLTDEDVFQLCDIMCGRLVPRVRRLTPAVRRQSRTLAR